MSKIRFYDIVRTDDLHISIPETSHLSIGTSPYFAHQHGLAIDIYHNLSLENYEVLSPVAGKILKIRHLLAPKPKFRGGVDKDFLILITNPSNPNLVWKLMHVKPFGKVGDQVDIGTPLGETIRNGYFAYWSSPHVHLEARLSEDAVRARGGKEFSLFFERNENSNSFSRTLNYRKVPVKIIRVYPEFILGKFPDSFYYKIPPFQGIRAEINQENCLLDGGIPHYKVGTVISGQNQNFNIYDSVFLGKNKIGILHETREKLGFLKFDLVRFSLNNKEIRGISSYLAKFPPLVKIIPNKKNQFFFKLNSIQTLNIS
jgi:hypothetical protein